jgi:hypothetical protein
LLPPGVPDRSLTYSEEYRYLPDTANAPISRSAPRFLGKSGCCFLELRSRCSQDRRSRPAAIIAGCAHPEHCTRCRTRALPPTSRRKAVCFKARARSRRNVSGHYKENADLLSKRSRSSAASPGCEPSTFLTETPKTRATCCACRRRSRMVP